ncbi:MAG: hypothetical protein WCH52_02675 [Bacteroidota bacterium]
MLMVLNILEQNAELQRKEKHGNNLERNWLLPGGNDYPSYDVCSE